MLRVDGVLVRPAQQPATERRMRPRFAKLSVPVVLTVIHHRSAVELRGERAVLLLLRGLGGVGAAGCDDRARVSSRAHITPDPGGGDVVR